MEKLFILAVVSLLFSHTAKGQSNQYVAQIDSIDLLEKFGKLSKIEASNLKDKYLDSVKIANNRMFEEYDSIKALQKEGKFSEAEMDQYRHRLETANILEMRNIELRRMIITERLKKEQSANGKKK